ncbi:MAG: T9SS type A sorting domain-containing protein, partial [Acholeplasmataceae bacterium]|nr:T9SS type A sorting domain-containing protein [Acholeplasmataceae bacterium]
GYIVAGYSYSNDGDVSGNHGNSDYWIVKLTGTVGLNETINNTIFSVYPNPATDLITVKGISPKTEIDITNMRGETVLRTVAKDNELTIDVSKLPAGMYFVNGQKFIKK